VIEISELDFITVGVDILPQSIPSRTTHYAVCIYDGTNEETIQKYDKVNLQKLLGIIRSSQAVYLATDNIYELVRNPSQIPHLCMQLLPNTKLVQITGSPLHGFTVLTKLMKQHGLDASGKLSPLAAAEACAILASKKLGYIVEPFEDETKIIVSRTKAKGPGGWSQKRYGRSMDTSVNQEAKGIESKLVEFRLDFDKRVSKSKYGAQKVVFSVYSPISEVTKIIKKKKGEICRVNIYPVNKERVEFIPSSQQVQAKSSLRRLIVGIDPGLTIGLSILDLNGRILKVNSYREASRGQIIREITRLGKPTLICVDVYPYPSYVEKIAATLNSRLYTPRSVMTVSEKNEISRKLAMEQGVLTKNAHQRDSLASAYRGYTKFRAEFENIDMKYFNEFDKSLRDEIKDLVVKGMSLVNAVEEVNKSLKEELPPPIQLVKPQEDELKITPNVKKLEETINLLQEQIDWERRKNTELNVELRELDEKVEYLQNRLEEGKSEYIESIQKEKVYLVKENQISFQREKIKLLEEELERYSERIEELKQVTWLRNQEDWLPLKIIKKFTTEEIERTAKTYGLGPGDTVLILDTTGGGGQTAEKLLSFKIKAILGNIDQLSYYAKKKLIETQIPIADSSDVEIKRIDEIAVIKEQDLLKIVEVAEQEIEEIVAEKKESFLDGLLDEYRKERKQEIEEYEERKQIEKRRRERYSEDNEQEEY
jgi:predicted RNase H-like nuclease (RuvC/YqgF family)